MLTLTRCPFHPRVTAVTRKKSRPMCQSASGRLPLNTHTLSLTQRSRSKLIIPVQGEKKLEIHHGDELTCNSPGTVRSQSSQLARDCSFTVVSTRQGLFVHSRLNSPGTVRSQSSQLAEHPGLKSGAAACQLSSTRNKKSADGD